MPTPVDRSKLRLAILEYLRKQPKGQFSCDMNARFGFLQQLIQGGLPLDDSDIKAVFEVIHELYREGVLAPGNPLVNATQNWDFPNYFVTRHGESVLANRDYEPHDRDGYFGRLKAQVSNPDPVVLRYLDESVAGYLAQLPLAAAVMLGCASEKAFLDLIDTMRAHLKDPAQKAAFVAEVDGARWIAQKHGVVKKFIPDKKQLPPDLAERLPLALDFVFAAIRLSRNDAGHPGGQFVERETVHGHLIVFPSYYVAIRGFEKHLKS